MSSEQSEWAVHIKKAINFVINMEIGYMTPPFGFNLFDLKGIVPPGITMGDIYRSVIPYTLVESTGLALVMFPQRVLYVIG